LDKDTKIKEMEITDEYIMVGPDVKGNVVAQNLQDLDADSVVLVTKDGQEVIGFITHTELVNAVADGHNPQEMFASDMMNTDFMEVLGDETLGNLMPKIAEKYPNVIVVIDYNCYCIGYFSKNDYNEAMIGLGYYDKSHDPKTPEEWRARGTALTTMGQIEEAIKCYENSLALHVDKERAWFDLAKGFEDDKKYKDAIMCYDKVVSINPENEIAWMNRGNVYSILRLPDRAIQSYTRAAQLSPDTDKPVINMGLAYLDLGEVKKAISCFSDAEEKKGKTAELWYWKGSAYDKAKKYEKAIKCYDQAIKLNSKYEDAWYNKGAALHILGDDKKAIECLEEVLRINPYNESAREAKLICEGNRTLF